jgi:hypothetical protein
VQNKVVVVGMGDGRRASLTPSIYGPDISWQTAKDTLLPAKHKKTESAHQMKYAATFDVVVLGLLVI